MIHSKISYYKKVLFYSKDENGILNGYEFSFMKDLSIFVTNFHKDFLHSTH